jgi:hypothetical protein
MLSKEQKLLAVCGVLPVLADFIEDINDERLFQKRLKQKANMLLQEIRENDERLMKNGNIELFQQQVDIQMAFRKWIKENF